MNASVGFAEENINSKNEDALKKIQPIKGPYADRIDTLLQRWPVKELDNWIKESDPIKILCVKTPDNSTFIGVLQFQKIKTGIERVTQILEDYPAYSELFDDLVKAEVKLQSQGKRLIFSEQVISSLPGVRNEKNEIYYEITSSTDASKIFRYRLVSSRNLISDDGFIYLKEVLPNETIYVEFDFLDASWGFAKFLLGSTKIWSENILGLLQSDSAVRIKAENLNLKNSEVKDQTHKLKFDKLADNCIENKKTWDEIFGK